MERKQQMALEMRIRPAARFAIETTSWQQNDQWLRW
jgi:hypothetical protein